MSLISEKLLLYNKLFIFSFIKTVHSIHKQGGRRNKKTHFQVDFLSLRTDELVAI